MSLVAAMAHKHQMLTSGPYDVTSIPVTLQELSSPALKENEPIFICSFLASELFFNDIVGLRFFTIILNHYTTVTNNFTGFSSPPTLQRPIHCPSFLSTIRLIWGSAHRTLTNLTCIVY